MVVGDERSVHDIHSACLTQTLSTLYSPEQIAAWMQGRTPEGYLKAATSGEIFFVAETVSGIIGFASWEDDELLALFVHPDFQGRGVGSQLFEACISDAIASGSSITRVKAANGAVAFYANRGFVSVARGSVVKHGVTIEDTRMVIDPVRLASPRREPNWRGLYVRDGVESGRSARGLMLRNWS
ncbi:GNAT family N-acetyltransferase [Bosea sp. NBC_00550]|uniref:GNAT family N-acetyltransferase n=1 Tax=Bosea sp. NBC_00550 TaxID=2969621 RepID=UPI00222F3E62|nr:GNAT family N-acetyltransferase [Bosea sp. NBC_00550]UZF94265.1 GNAT family N-acetyltransferase [Bosea sp. NBC_00550]